MVTLAIVGATGAVGLEAIELLNERDTKFDNLRLFASKSSVGKIFIVKGELCVVEEYTSPSQFDDIDCAILATSAEISKEIINGHTKKKCVFIDNSSAFRMDKNVPLIVPEININTVGLSNVIANPNCSTIILLMALYPLHKENKIQHINVSTYQAASGGGLAAMKELKLQAESFAMGKEMCTDVFGRQYLFNAFSHNSEIDRESGYNGEEIKMINETHKILNDDDIDIDVTCIRIPTLRSHLESVTIKFSEPTSEEFIRNTLESAPGVTIRDDREKNAFPEPLVSTNQNNICVGRIRQSFRKDNTVFQLMISGDQLRKGAALNAIQIYECLSE